MGDFYGYENYEDWYDNGPGSEAFKERTARDLREYRKLEMQKELKRVKKNELIAKKLKNIKAILKQKSSSAQKIKQINKICKCKTIGVLK